MPHYDDCQLSDAKVTTFSSNADNSRCAGSSPDVIRTLCSAVRRMAVLLLLLAALIPGLYPQEGGSTLRYVYDELGRLIAVVDPASDTAVYSYDSVGNLLSISRTSSATVSILHFTPDRGVAGTSVTIYGTGFSSVPNEDTVRFNGVAATVTSAAATRLVVAVPQNATTGTISVTSPSGTATSAKPFTVAANAAPTISGFTPSVAPAGVAVTISGTNFESTPSNNKVRVNGGPLWTTGTASQSELSSTMPKGATSGKISVRTGSGIGFSAGDLFVPPTPYTAGDVEATSRMTIGSASAVSVTTATKVAMVLFDGSAGQRISLKMSSVTITVGNLYIYNPDGSTLGSAGINTGGGFIDTKTLSATGTYTIFIDPTGAYTGNVTVTLYNVPADVQGAIVINDPATPVTIGTPGQNGQLTFAGTASQ